MSICQTRSIVTTQRIRVWLLGLIALTAISAAAPAYAEHTVLYRFKGGRDGSTLEAGLVIAPDGALYGMTYFGGNVSGLHPGYGTVFKLAPPAPPSIKWTRTVLHRFSGTDGQFPYARLTRDEAGILYGTTSYGGSFNRGVAFKLVPPATDETKWSYSVLHHFSGGKDDGSYLYSGLVLDDSGALYGTTEGGGRSGLGTVFKLAPPKPPSEKWKTSILYSFKRRPDGVLPFSGVVFDKAGNLYGTTLAGGQEDNGTVYRLSPPTPPSIEWTENIIHSFTGYEASPDGDLVIDDDGTLYGAAGGIEHGIIYKLERSSGGGEWTKKTIHNFIGLAGGASPSELTLDRDGSLYGMTRSGGAGRGLVFKLTPPIAPSSDWTKTVLHVFEKAKNGWTPGENAALVLDRGVLYGTTTTGGRDHGTVFKLE